MQAIFLSDPAAMNRQDTIFDIPDMNCQGCAERIERVLTRQGGVRSVEVHLKEGRASVTYDADATDPEALQSAIKTTGYTPQPG